MTHAVTIESSRTVSIVSRHSSEAEARAEAAEIRASHRAQLEAEGGRVHVRLLRDRSDRAVRQLARLTTDQLLRVCRLYESLESRGARDALYVARRVVAARHLSYLQRWAWALRRSGLEAPALAEALTEAGVSP